MKRIETMKQGDEISLPGTVESLAQALAPVVTGGGWNDHGQAVVEWEVDFGPLQRAISPAYGRHPEGVAEGSGGGETILRLAVIEVMDGLAVQCIERIDGGQRWLHVFTYGVSAHLGVCANKSCTTCHGRGWTT